MQLLERIEHILVVISQSINTEITVEELVITYTVTREEILKQYAEVKKSGEELLARLAMPVLTDEG